MSSSLFGYLEDQPRKGRPTIKRDQGGHERWADAILPADAEAGTIETPTSRKPLYVVAIIVFLAAGLLSLQLFRLQILNGQRNLGLADGNRLRQKISRAPRGVIYDRHKNLLVRNLGSYDVTVTPSLLPSNPATRQQVYSTVAGLLGLPYDQVFAKAEGDCVNGEVAAKKDHARAEADCLTTSQARLVTSNVDQNTAVNFDQSKNNVPGFSLDLNQIRQYLDNGALSSILGYTGRINEQEYSDHPNYEPTDLIGKLGIEKQYESLLRGQSGSEQIEVDASGQPIKLLASKSSQPGSNLVLTIDTDLQNDLANNIKAQMSASGATQAAGVAINPKTGEILAAVNLPTYDNNLFAKGISQTDFSKLLKDPAQPLFNKSMSGAYPTGSIIKPLIGSAALQEHVVTPDTTVNDTGALEITNKYNKDIKYLFRSYEPGGLGIVNISKAIAVSSNVFFYTVGGGYGNIGGLGVDRLTAYYHKFGLGHKTGVDIPEETAGVVPTPDWKKQQTGEDWVLGDTYNISVGQGDLKASPLQMAVAEAAVANGGKVMQPHLLKEVDGPGGQVTQTFQPKVVEQNFISPENNQLIRSAMRDVVTRPYGTACCRLEQEVPVHVAAKTGTAETDPNGNKKPDAWFTAYAPYEDPQIEIVVMIQNAGEGAQFAGPAVRETLKWCFTRPGGCVQ